RGHGGLADVEFLVQLFQIHHGREKPNLLHSNVWDALDSLETAGLIPTTDVAILREGYSFLRLVEARLRIVTDRPLTELPDNPDDLAKLARRLGFEASDQFLDEVQRTTASIRAVYEKLTSGA